MDRTPTASKPQPTIRRPNLRLLAGTLAAIVVLTPAGYFWRSYQLRRTSQAFLERADALEKDSQWRKAATVLQHYLQLKPQDLSARIRRTEAFDRSAADLPGKVRAVELYYDTLGTMQASPRTDELESKQPEMRHRLTELLVECGRFPAAESQAMEFLASRKADPAGLRLLALARYGQLSSGTLAGSPQGEKLLGKSLLEAIAANPGDVKLSVAAAKVLRENAALPVLAEDARTVAAPTVVSPETKGSLPEAARCQLADRIMDGMVLADPSSVPARLARYRYRSQYRLAGALDDVRAALEAAPRDVEVLLIAAQQARTDQAALGETAENLFQRAMAVAPAEPRPYLGLGELYVEQKNPERAVELWRSGLKNSSKEDINLNLRLAETLIALGRLDEVCGDAKPTAGGAKTGHADLPLERLRATLRQHGPRLKKLDRLKLEAAVDLVEARWLLAKGYPSRAIPLLERVKATESGAAAPPSQVAATRMLLGMAYGAIGQTDRSAAAYGEASLTLPDSPQPLLEAATAWLAARQPERAVLVCEQAKRLRDTPVTRLALAQAMFQQQVAAPKQQRNWQLFIVALEDAKREAKLLTEPWQVQLLEVNYLLVIQGEGSRPGVATASPWGVLRQAETENPDSAALWATLALSYQRLKRPQDADRALKRFEEICQDPAQRCVVRAGLLLRRGQLDEARKVLLLGLEEAGAVNASRLRWMLVEVELAAGELGKAEAEAEKLHLAAPSNPRWVLSLAELAVEQEDPIKMECWEKVLRDLEGPNGTWWKYYRGRRLAAAVASETRGGDPRIVELEDLRAQLLGQRPSWAAAHYLSGLVCELRGQPARALEAYGRAVRLGASEAGLYDRILGLIYGLGRFDAAEEYLSQLRNLGGWSGALSGWESDLPGNRGTQSDPEQRRQRLARDIAAAERRCRQQPQSAWAWLRLGQLRLGARTVGETADDGKSADAENAFQQAIRLAPADVRGYNGLFIYYLSSGRRPQAEQILQTLVNNPSVPPPQRALAVGAGYEAIGDLSRALSYYREGEKLDANNVEIKRRLAALLIRTDRAEAEKALRALHRSAPNLESARVNLAQVLAARALAASGPEEDALWKEVEELLHHARAEQSQSVIDRRIFAALLFRRGGRENRQRAQQILVELAADSNTAADLDHLLLARIYADQSRLARAQGRAPEASSAFQAAEKEYLQLVQQPTPQPAHLLAYVAFLLDNGRTAETAPWRAKLETLQDPQAAAAYVDLLLKHELYSEARQPLDKLQAQAGDTLWTANLRIRWLRGTNATAQIEPVIASLAERSLREAATDPRGQAAAWATLGNLWMAAGRTERAKPCFSKLAEIVPQEYPPLAMCLAKSGETGEALRRCMEAAKGDTGPRPALTAAAVLLAGKPAAADFHTAEPLLSKSLQQHPGRNDLLVRVANVRLLQGRTAEVLQLYRQAAQSAPKDAGVLNNLAAILAEQPATLAEATALIDRAIDEAGPLNELLDTKGMVLFHAGRPAEAIPCLQTAVSGPSPDPRSHFHLALAYDSCGKSQEAAQALAAARAHDLGGHFLTEKERQLLAALDQRVPPPSR